jgi:hypothetical protein
MIHRKFFEKGIILFTIIVILLSGCDKEKAFILLSSKPISAETFNPVGRESVFVAGNKVYFVLYNPKPFTSPILRVQILRWDRTIAPPYGLTVEQGRDFEVDTTQNYAINSFCLYREGSYRLRVFSKDNLINPLAEFNFEMKEP